MGEEGKALLFDDTFTHDVWNRSDQRRIILNVDVKRPELGTPTDEVCRAQFFKMLRLLNENGQLESSVDGGKYSSVVPPRPMALSPRPMRIRHHLPDIADDVISTVIGAFYPDYR